MSHILDAQELVLYGSHPFVYCPMPRQSFPVENLRFGEDGTHKLSWRLDACGQLGGIGFLRSETIRAIAQLRLFDCNMVLIHGEMVVKSNTPEPVFQLERLPEDLHIWTFPPLLNRSSTYRYTLEMVLEGEPGEAFHLELALVAVGD